MDTENFSSALNRRLVHGLIKKDSVVIRCQTSLFESCANSLIVPCMCCTPIFLSGKLCNLVSLHPRQFVKDSEILQFRNLVDYNQEKVEKLLKDQCPCSLYGESTLWVNFYRMERKGQQKRGRYNS